MALDPSEDAPALAAERKAQAASLEEDAVNKAKAALSVIDPPRLRRPLPPSLRHSAESMRVPSLWKAAFPAVPDEDEAAKATRLEALAAAVEAAKAEVHQAMGTKKQARKQIAW